MNYKGRVSILGGDIRQLAVADFFVAKGFDVTLWGIDSKKCKREYKTEEELSCAVSDSEICIFPLPVSNEGIRLNAPFLGDKALKLSDIVDLLPNNVTVFGGKMPADFSKKLEEKRIRFFDYFEDECLCIKNALLTAEAAIEIAMREHHGTVDSSKTMVIGYGRIGKILTNILVKMNSDVTVAARKDTDLAYATCMGAAGFKLSGEDNDELLEINNGYDIVFNTVPVRLINSELIGKLNKKTIIIDLASAPGCVDIRQARDGGLNVVRALSLPGKYSPMRAGKIIAESIYNTVMESGL